MANLKACKKCGRIKSLHQFYTSLLTQDGYENKCKECRKIRMRRIAHTDQAHQRKALYQKEWVSKNRDKVAAQALRTRQKVRRDCIIAYGGNPPRCKCCGEKEYRFLQLDHLNGGGTKERTKYGAGTGLFITLRKRKYPKGYQILCANCNHAKQYGICPHKLKHGKN